MDPSTMTPEELAAAQAFADAMMDKVYGFVLVLVYLSIGVFVASYFQVCFLSFFLSFFHPSLLLLLFFFFQNPNPPLASNSFPFSTPHLLPFISKVAMFTLVGNSQANKIRQHYLTAILRQEVGWFDKRTSGQLTSRFSTGIPRIRDGISEQLSNLFVNISLCITGLIISFLSSWKVALVTLGVMPAMVITAGLVGRILLVFSSKGDKAYAKAGGISQEVWNPLTFHVTSPSS
jgi:ABC-type multidrug transport system fused ATPase/permease subunit